MPGPRGTTGLTDEIERLLEVLFEVGVAVVQDGQTFVHDARGPLVHDRRRGLLAGGHVQHAGHADGRHAVPVVRVLPVAQVQERQHFGQRMGVHQFAGHRLLQRRAPGAAAAVGRRGQQRILAHVLVPGVELFVATCGQQRNKLNRRSRFSSSFRVNVFISVHNVDDDTRSARAAISHETI